MSSQTGKLLELEEIAAGKTFVCGDLHGCYHDLMALLKANEFDFGDDRLICCGDLVDRGPDSLMCVSLVDEPWFYTVLGNHEDMALQCITNRDNGTVDPWWAANGGHWFYSLNYEETKELLINKFSDLPVGIDVKVNGHTIAIIHADPVYDSWDKTKDVLRSINKFQWTSCDNCNSEVDNILANALWSRGRVGDEVQIEGCDLMIHGHTIMKEPVYLGNRLFLDTGSFLKYWDGHDGHISLICLNAMF